MSDTRKIVLLYEEGGKQQGGVFDLNNVQPLAGFIEQTPIGPSKLEAQLANPQNPEDFAYATLNHQNKPVPIDYFSRLMSVR